MSPNTRNVLNKNFFKNIFLMEKCHLNQTEQSIESQILSATVITDNLQASNLGLLQQSQNI